MTQPIVGEFTQKAIRLSQQHIGALEHEFKPGITFTPQGLGRAYAVYGWIVGLLHGGMDPAEVEDIARDFNNQLLYLARYGGQHTIFYEYLGSPREAKAPAYVVEIGDDATFNGFTLRWNRLLDTPDKIQEYETNSGKEAKKFFHHPDAVYGFSFNGGLIYHGPGAGVSNAVTLTGQLWGVHT